jgi:hypothetical protein
MSPIGANLSSSRQKYRLKGAPSRRLEQSVENLIETRPHPFNAVHDDDEKGGFEQMLNAPD